MTTAEIEKLKQGIWDFIVEKHGDQKRKYTNAPYTDHLKAVSELVAQYEGVEATIAAMSHDLFEDTDCTGDQLHAKLVELGCPEFNATRIVNMVYDCTDIFTSEKYPYDNREKRKKMEAERLSTIQKESQSIKYADFIDNISSIAKYDPDFARTYIQEKIRILDGMRAGNIKLLIGACAALAEAEKEIMYARTWS